MQTKSIITKKPGMTVTTDVKAGNFIDDMLAKAQNSANAAVASKKNVIKKNVKSWEAPAPTAGPMVAGPQE